MKYYKIIQNGTFIGIINSNSFMRYQDSNEMFIGADETTGDLASCKDRLYRATWMKPMNQNITNLYESVEITEISREEYLIFMKAIENNEVIEDQEEKIPIPVIPEIHNTDVSIEFIRESKLNEMSYICRITIESGIDFEIRGETKHFSLTTQDQLNLMSAQTMAQTQTLIPYHADGEETDFYTKEEINQLAEAAAAFKVQHTTYYNSLKTYINALETIEEISAITYGVEIPDEYKSDVLKVLEQ